MASEEHDLVELRTSLERAVGPRPASTLMRHLPAVPATALATQDDIRDVQAEMVASFRRVDEQLNEIRVAIANLEAAMVSKMQTMESGMLTKMHSLTVTLMSTFIAALVTVVVAVTAIALFR